VTRASERAVGAVRELILRGDFAAGARLGEAELAERLGVSRTPVREALTRLAAEGLVEIVPNRGARVSSWTVAELEEVFDLRAALEPRLTALAVPHADEPHIAELEALAQEMLAVGTPGPDQDLDAIVPLNRAFHGRLVELADHAAMASALAGAIHAPIVLRNFHAYDDASLRRSLAHHLEIVAAIRASDPAWAQAVMTAHIHNARAVMVRTAREQEDS
jgi:DNA-binding GntR family transcriptional regulator